MTGYHDITSGNPNPKTLVPGSELAHLATSDALCPMAFAAGAGVIGPVAVFKQLR